MIEEILVLKAEVDRLISIGEIEEADRYQAIIDNLQRGLPKGTSHGGD